MIQIPMQRAVVRSPNPVRSVALGMEARGKVEVGAKMLGGCGAV